jgi:phosphinothricin acetyltransferase
MRLISCESAHASAILAILNEAIANSTALYDYKPRTAAMMAEWFEAKRRGSYPVIGVVDDAGQLLGFGSYGPFRAWPAYKYSVEHSLYVERSQRRQGVGRLLLAELIACARRQDYHLLIGGIDAHNAASIALHRRLGFELCAHIRQAGFKFNRWLDLQFYQLILDTPRQPLDG